jgi:hypothetical protein
MTQAKQPREFFARGASKYLLLVFALFFLAVQSITLVHSHGGDLDKHVDCNLCLKIGSSHDALPSSAINLVIPTLRHRYAPVHETATVIAQVPANSRAPPSIV